MTKYFSKPHKKFLLKAHLIFVVKYRKNLLSNKSLNDTIMFACNSAATKNFQIDLMKSDKNHIHFMINYDPDVSISQIVRRLKQFSCVQVWKMHGNILLKHFWKDKIFWTKGYFACSVGNASAEIIQKYIENQG